MSSDLLYSWGWSPLSPPPKFWDCRHVLLYVTSLRLLTWPGTLWFVRRQISSIAQGRMTRVEDKQREGVIPVTCRKLVCRRQMALWCWTLPVFSLLSPLSHLGSAEIVSEWRNVKLIEGSWLAMELSKKVAEPGLGCSKLLYASG